MRPNDTFQAGSRSVPIKIIFPYTVLTLLWIYFSNDILSFLIKDPQTLNLFLKSKNLCYVVVSSIVLYLLFRAATYSLRQSESKYRHLFENAAVSIWEEDFSAVKGFFDQQRALGVDDWKVYFDNNPQAVKQCASLVRITDFNQEGLRFLGVKNKEQARRNLDHYFTESSPESFKEELIALAKGSTQWTGERPARSLNGETKELLFKLSVVPGYEEDLSKVLVSILDITETKKVTKILQLKEQRLRQIIDLVPHFIFAKDIEGRFILGNRSIAEAYGTTVENLVGKKNSDLTKSREEDYHFHQDDLEVIHSGKPKFIPQETFTNAQGQVRVFSTTKIPFTASGNHSPCVLGVAIDITDHKHLESKFLTLAHYDAVTTFPNRTLFFERANLGLSHARRSNTSCAVLFIDLDHFKNINDTLGHSVGDELLKDTALKLSECVREIDTITRFGGDKFIVFLNGLEEAQSAQHIAERIREKLNSSRLILGHDLFVTASIGIATFPNDGHNLEELLKNADTAMSVAKEVGRNAFCFFDGTMNERAVTRMQIERGLRGALSKDEFKLYYQPIIGVQDGKVRGFEALLRWFRGDGVLVCPNDFICVAEETGLIISIGEWVLKEACRMGRKLQDRGVEDIIMSVNISVVQLRHKAIIDIIRNALEEAGLSAHCLEIEVTESLFIGSFDASIDILKQIRDMGVKISLDDFGTGYSSLSHLQRLPITSLKIDRLFIKEIMNEGVEMAMTATIISLAHTLNLGVIAEGVEYDLQLKNLAQEQCDYFQGFLFGKPMPEEKAIAFLEEKIS